MDQTKESMPESLDLHGVTVHKLVLSEVVKFSQEMKALPQLFAAFQSADESNILEKVAPEIINALPAVLRMLEIATRKTTAELDAILSPEQAVECFFAIFKVNDFFSAGKKAGELISGLNLKKS